MHSSPEYISNDENLDDFIHCKQYRGQSSNKTVSWRKDFGSSTAYTLSIQNNKFMKVKMQQGVQTDSRNIVIMPIPVDLNDRGKETKLADG